MPFLTKEHIPIPTKDLLSWIFDDPAYDQDKPIYFDALTPSRNLSCNQARLLIRQLIAGLHAAGVQRDTCVCITAFNDIYYSMLVLAIIGAGGVVAATNPGYTHAEIVHHLRTAKARICIAEPELVGAVRAAARECGIGNASVFVFDHEGNGGGVGNGEGLKSWRTLLERGERDWVRFEGREGAEKTTAAMLFSSGTTGLPKAAQLSHYNLVAEHTLVYEWKVMPYEIRRLLAMPFFHAGVFPGSHFSTFRSGIKSYVLRRFELDRWLHCCTRYQITDAILVPPMVMAISNAPHWRVPGPPKYSLKSLRAPICGAAALTKEAQARLLPLLGDGATFNQGWAMTETSCMASMMHWPESDDTGSVGRPLPCMDFKLLDDAGNDMGETYNVPGELAVRGPTVVRGYFENPEANARDWDAEGFFRTGDILYCDRESKKWYIIDRKKELLKVRGFQVAPPEIEGLLLLHPHIVDAAVIGVTRSEEEGEIPRAYVVKRPGSKEAEGLREADVAAYVAERLIKYKRLDGGVVFVQEIPKSASGKILKRLLRERAKREMGAKI